MRFIKTIFFFFFRKYQENGRALRRPNICNDVSPAPITLSYTNLKTTTNDDTDDASSVSSFSSGRSSLYVTPQKYLSEQNNIDNKPYSALTGSNVIGTGRGALKFTSDGFNKEKVNSPIGKSVNEENKMKGVKGQNTHNRAFGRGIIRQMLLDCQKNSS